MPFLKFIPDFQKGRMIMELHIKVYGQVMAIEVSIEVYEYLDLADHKKENLMHEQRRHWDGREFDDYIIAHECSRSYYETPEQWLCRKETCHEITAALESCTEIQRQRFLLFALDGLSYSEIGKLCGCSRYAARDSIETVRKKCRELLK